MKRLLFIAILTFYVMMMNAQNQINLTIDNRTITATLADTDAASALAALLAEGAISVNMTDYGGFEKVGQLPQALPTSNSQITTHPGDIMLYQGTNIVIFYESNSWSYTPLGRVDERFIPDLEDFLGKGNKNLIISLPEAAALKLTESCNESKEQDNIIFDLKGKRMANYPANPGIYIINGNKRIIK